VQAAQADYRSRPANQQTARERARAFRLANPDRRSEYERRRRAFKKSTTIGFIEPTDLAAKFAYWGERCWMCRSPEDLEVDHVKPLSKGGAHVLSNLRPACGTCNRTKRERWPIAPEVLVGQHRLPWDRAT
jgi:5-methylcytosine-specific restriction endonuclease McrA